MIELINKGVYYFGGKLMLKGEVEKPEDPMDAKEKTLAFRVLRAHSVREANLNNMHFRFDTLVSAGDESVNIIKKAAKDNLEYFPVPYVLGAESEKENAFSLSAAKRYGGFFAPLSGNELYDYVCTRLAACGNMILTQGGRQWCGALGCIAVKGDAKEFDKQLKVQTYDLTAPELVIVLIEGDLAGKNVSAVAKALKDAVADGRFAGKVIEIGGSGLASLTWEARAEIDALLDETVCLGTVWHTDDTVKGYFEKIGRPEAFDKMIPSEGAYYDYAIKIDLSNTPDDERSDFEIKTFDSSFLKKKCYNGFPIPDPSVKLADI